MSGHGECLVFSKLFKSSHQRTNRSSDFAGRNDKSAFKKSFLKFHFLDYISHFKQSARFVLFSQDLNTS